MASTISAGTSSGTALNLVGDTSGALALQTNNGTTALTIDTSQNVGIGIAVPTQNGGGGSKVLHINSTGATDWSTTHYTTGGTGTTGLDGLVVGIIGGTDSYVLNYENTNLILGTNASERVRITNAGNVGIGSNNPLYPLEVNGAGQFGGYARITASGGGQRLLMGNQDSIGTNKPSIITAGNSNISFGYGDSWSTNGGNFTNLFSINVTGTSNDFQSVLAGGTTLYPAYFARSFVAVNQQGTQAILCSGNVSSITDQGTGLTLVTMTTAMPDINYTVTNGISGSGVISGVSLEVNRNSSSSYQLRALSSSSPTAYDMNYVTAIVMR